MARTISALLLVSAAILLAASSIHYSRGDGSTNGGSATTRTTHLHFYMHDEYTGPNPTAALIVPGRAPLSDSKVGTSRRRFGDVAVMNNALTEGPQRGSPRVGTAQGFTVRVSERGSVNALSMHLVMEHGEFAGSSLVVNSRVDTDMAVRESVVVGGTGRFRFARGYALSRSYDYDLAKGGIVEIDVYLY